MRVAPEPAAIAVSDRSYRNRGQQSGIVCSWPKADEFPPWSSARLRTRPAGDQGRILLVYGL